MDSNFWDTLAIRNKSTGYGDSYISSFDQLMRLRCTKMILDDYASKRTTEGNVLLDFGCGRGDFSGYFSDNFETVYGFDTSQEILNIAQKRNNRRNIQYINSLNAIEKKADTVFSITVLQHILDDIELVATLKKIHEETRPGALFIALESLKEDIFRIKQPSHVKARPFELWVKLFEEAGFTLKESKSFYNPYLIKTEAFKKYEKRTKLFLKLRHLFMRLHINHSIFDILFINTAKLLLKNKDNVDGIISEHSFSKFFILESI